MKCILCNSPTNFFAEEREISYYQCENCEAVVMDKADYVTKTAEQERYEEHNNDVTDPRYQRFVQPVVDAVLKYTDTSARGLDFGAGTGPVITKMLREQEYEMFLYDPFFWNKPENLEKKYEFIVCCETMEHFHQPREEFEKLHSLLEEDGYLFCKTKLYSDKVLFSGWRYAHDQTHVIFYTKNSLEWISENIGFDLLYAGDDVIIFKKHNI
jgi:2-polyprenyl-3-methyl-5-hydroxy-6-metoxy-1,4-benzoquinol methylase